MSDRHHHGHKHPLPRLTYSQRKSMNAAVVGVLQQFVVIIISLGLANAFLVFAPQKEFALPSLLSFAIYVLVGMRFLAANLLYLAYQYGRGERHHKRIHADASGMVVTGILIGLAGSYVNAGVTSAPNADFRFYLCLFFVLVADALFSTWSHSANPVGESSSADPERERKLKDCDQRWVINNTVFAVMIGALLAFEWFGSKLAPELFYGLMGAIVLGSLIVLRRTYDGLWHFTAPIFLAIAAWLGFAHPDVTNWLMLVTVANSVVSFMLTYEGCLLADGETPAQQTAAAAAH